MGRISDLSSAVEQLRELEKTQMQLLRKQWSYEREIERLKATVSNYRDQIESAKSEIRTTAQDMQLNRRENPPDLTDEFCDAVTDWIERASAIRKSSNLDMMF